MITEFQGQYRFLSNFWPAVVLMDGVFYPSVENAYQAAKTLDLDAREVFEDCTPGQAKRLGKSLPLRSDWGKVRVPLMKSFITQKFQKHNDIGRKLIATENQEIIEGNTWGDTFWGECRGEGLNNLGKLIMARREEIK